MNPRHAIIDTIRHAAARHGISETVLLAMITHESSLNPDARSPKGARGLGQFTYRAAVEMGLPPSLASDPWHNVDAAARYMKKYDIRKPEDYILYNLGPSGGRKLLDFMSGKKGVELNKGDIDNLKAQGVGGNIPENAHAEMSAEDLRAAVTEAITVQRERLSGRMDKAVKQLDARSTMVRDGKWEGIDRESLTSTDISPKYIEVPTIDEEQDFKGQVAEEQFTIEAKEKRYNKREEARKDLASLPDTPENREKREKLQSVIDKIGNNVLTPEEASSRMSASAARLNERLGFPVRASGQDVSADHASPPNLRGGFAMPSEGQVPSAPDTGSSFAIPGAPPTQAAPQAPAPAAEVVEPAPFEQSADEEVRKLNETAPEIHRVEPEEPPPETDEPAPDTAFEAAFQPINDQTMEEHQFAHYMDNVNAMPPVGMSDTVSEAQKRSAWEADLPGGGQSFATSEDRFADQSLQQSVTPLPGQATTEKPLHPETEYVVARHRHRMETRGEGAGLWGSAKYAGMKLAQTLPAATTGWLDIVDQVSGGTVPVSGPGVDPMLDVETQREFSEYMSQESEKLGWELGLAGRAPGYVTGFIGSILSSSVAFMRGVTELTAGAGAAALGLEGADDMVTRGAVLTLGNIPVVGSVGGLLGKGVSKAATSLAPRLVARVMPENALRTSVARSVLGMGATPARHGGIPLSPGGYFGMQFSEGSDAYRAQGIDPSEHIASNLLVSAALSTAGLAADSMVLGVSGPVFKSMSGAAVKTARTAAAAGNTTKARIAEVLNSALSLRYNGANTRGLYKELGELAVKTLTASATEMGTEFMENYVPEVIARAEKIQSGTPGMGDAEALAAGFSEMKNDPSFKRSLSAMMEEVGVGAALMSFVPGSFSLASRASALRTAVKMKAVLDERNPAVLGGMTLNLSREELVRVASEMGRDPKELYAEVASDPSKFDGDSPTLPVNPNIVESELYNKIRDHIGVEGYSKSVAETRREADEIEEALKAVTSERMPDDLKATFETRLAEVEELLKDKENLPIPAAEIATKVEALSDMIASARDIGLLDIEPFAERFTKSVDRTVKTAKEVTKSQVALDSIDYYERDSALAIALAEEMYGKTLNDMGDQVEMMMVDRLEKASKRAMSPITRQAIARKAVSQYLTGKMQGKVAGKDAKAVSELFASVFSNIFEGDDIAAVRALDRVGFEITSEGMEKGVFGVTRVSRQQDTGRKQIKVALDKRKGAQQAGTLIHEMMHVVVELLATMTGQDGRATDMHDLLLHAAGGEMGGNFTAEMQERLALKFERYVAEGVTDAPYLKQVFRKLSRIIAGMWRVMHQFGGRFISGTDLDGSTRGIFDRLVTNEAERVVADAVDSYRVSTGDIELFSQEMFADPVEAEKYRAELEDARNAVVAKIVDEVSGERLAKRELEFSKKFEENLPKAAMLIAKNPIYRMLSNLRDGKEPDGSKSPVQFYLSDSDPTITPEIRAILSIHGIKTFKGKPKGKTLTTFATQAIAVFGDVQSAQRDLAAAPELDTAIRGAAFDLTASELGTPGYPEQFHEQILKEIEEGKHRSKRIKGEVALIMSGKIPSKMEMAPPTEANMREAKQLAVASLSSKPLGDISLQAYRKEAAAAARQARESMRKGDLVAAVKWKKAELFAVEKLEEGRKILARSRTDMAAISRVITKLDGRTMLRAGHGIREHLLALSSRLGVLKGKDERAADPAAMVEALAELGFHAHLDPELLKAVGARKNMTATQLSELREHFESMNEIAENIVSGVNQARKQDAENKVLDILTHSREHMKEVFGPNEATLTRASSVNRILTGTANYVASHIKVENLLMVLDGGIARGPAWRAIFEPIYKAETAEMVEMKRVQEQLNKALSVYEDGELGQTVSFRGETITRDRLLSMYLNLGTRGNAEALMAGLGLTEGDIATLHSLMREKDLKAVRGVGEVLNQFGPKVKELYRKLSGRDVKLVDTSGFSIGGVQLGGWYYPISYDSKKVAENRQMYGNPFSDKTADMEAMSVVDMFGDQSSLLMTQNNHVLERKKAAGAPLNLDLNEVLGRHLAVMVHDLTHREAIIEVARVVTNDSFLKGASRHIGSAGANQFMPWLKQVANDHRAAVGTPVDRFIDNLSSRAVFASLAANLGTGISQITGYAISMSHLGPKWAALGVAAAFRRSHNNGKNELDMGSYSFMVSKSEQMRNRISNGYSIEAKEAMGRLGVELQGDDTARRMAMQFIGAAQMLVDVPTWHGAYYKALAGEVNGVLAGDDYEAVGYADQAVRITQGTASAKDLSALQAGRGITKLLSRFLSFFITVLNYNTTLVSKLAKRDLSASDVAAVSGGLMLTIMVPSFIDSVLRGRDKLIPDLDDEDDMKAWLARRAKDGAEMTFGGLVGVKDVVGVASSLMTGQPDMGSSSVAGRALEDFGTALYVPIAYATDEDYEPSMRHIKAMVMSLSVAGKLPGSMIFRGYQLIKAIHDDDIDDGDYLEMMHTLTRGNKPRYLND